MEPIVNILQKDQEGFTLAHYQPVLVCGKPIGWLHQNKRLLLEGLHPSITLHKDHIALEVATPTPQSLTSLFITLNKKLVALGALQEGHHNEMATVVSHDLQHPLLAMYRYALTFWGVRLFAIHLNGWVVQNGEKQMWVAKRSLTAKQEPGALDHLVCGSLVSGLSVQENLYKEGEEEADISPQQLAHARPVGTTACTIERDEKLFRFTPFMYDLALPQDFIPKNKDGAIDGFFLMPVKSFLTDPTLLQRFKTACRVVIVSFLVRHGYLTPDHPHYLPITALLSKGFCST